MHALPTELSKDIIDGLVERHFAVVVDALPDVLIEGLRACAQERVFRAAKVGRNGVSLPTTRNDEIAWLEFEDPRERALFDVFEKLRLDLNRALFLGLVDFEAHFARYEAGHFYQRHLDRFNDESARTISVVLYLNDDWTTADGGCLRLYTEPPREITPEAGTLVCFTSDDIEHEVLPARRSRLSIAAWFRRARK